MGRITYSFPAPCIRDYDPVDGLLSPALNRPTGTTVDMLLAWIQG